MLWDFRVRDTDTTQPEDRDKEQLNRPPVCLTEETRNWASRLKQTVPFQQHSTLRSTLEKERVGERHKIDFGCCIWRKGNELLASTRVSNKQNLNRVSIVRESRKCRHDRVVSAGALSCLMIQVLGTHHGVGSKWGPHRSYEHRQGRSLRPFLFYD